MRADRSTRFVVAAVDSIYLNGVLQKHVIMFDDACGVIQRYKTDKNGFVMSSDKVEFDLEIVYGKVEVTLNPGWSWENDAFRIDVMKSATNWKRNET